MKVFVGRNNFSFSLFLFGLLLVVAAPVRAEDEAEGEAEAETELAKVDEDKAHADYKGCGKDGKECRGIPLGCQETGQGGKITTT